MNRLTLVVPLAAGALTLMALAPQTFAFAGQQNASDVQPPVKYTMTRKAAELSPLIVNGHHFSFPVALQIYKKALTRSWSSSRADLDKLVCHWREPLGTHMQTLHCETNRQHRHIAAETQLAISNAGGDKESLYQALVNGRIPVMMATFSSKYPIARSTFAPLLKKLPSADSSYTLRITGKKGRPALDYVIKDGDLVHIYHYMYNNGKMEKH